MKNVRIYTCHHKPSAFLSSTVIIPIHVGKANSFNDMGFSGDDSGENISFKNPFYCELTAQYWVWKNAPFFDYVGFMHYRRHFNFSVRQDYVEDNWGLVNAEMIDPEYQKTFGLNDTTILQCLQNTDIIVPKKWDVRAAGSKNNFDHYRFYPHLQNHFYQSAIDSLLDLYPDYMLAVQEFNDATSGYYSNMFVMSGELFHDYSMWLFSILDELEHRIAFNNYSEEEKRVVGHIAERLFNIYLIYTQKRVSLRLKEVQRTFIRTVTFNGHLSPTFFKNNVPIVICFDDNYSLSGGVLINSIIHNASIGLNYDLIVLEYGISWRNKNRLVSLIAQHENFSLRFFDLHAFSELKNVYTRSHFSAATYARLFIPYLLKDMDRAIFIDADTVVESDLAELMQVPLGNNLVAAVRDVVMEGFVKFGNMVHGERGVITSEQYLKTELGMDDTNKYFQAGIIVFNLAQMKQENIFSSLMDELKGKKYYFLDQDIMNKVFYDRVYYLPMCWNVYHGNGNSDGFFPNLKFSTYMDFLVARQHPRMIHYAGDQKPWKNAQVDFFDNFLKYVINTPWQKDLYDCLVTLPINMGSVMSLEAKQLRIKIKDLLIPMINRLAPLGSVRRQHFSKYYYKIRMLFWVE